MKAKIILILSSLLSTLVGCSAFNRHNAVEDGPSYLVIADTEYRKAGAFKVDLLWVGNKKNGKFDPLFMPTIEHEIPTHLSTEAFTEQSKKAAFDSGFQAGNAIIKGDLNIGMENEQTSKGTYKVFLIRDIYDLIGELNSEKNRARIEDLKFYDEPRIVIGIATAFGQESNIKKANNGKVGLTLGQFSYAPEIRIGGNQESTSTVKLSDGTTFAYELARLCFSETGDRIRVASLDPDRPTADTKCPHGTFKSIVSLQEAKAAKRAREK